MEHTVTMMVMVANVRDFLAGLTTRRDSRVYSH